jgi:ABC-type transport system involved in cytochrome bd biosynthesis fused ATPase/permease subunit
VKPFDLRLAREVAAVRSSIGITAVFSFISAILYVAQSISLARVISSVFLNHDSIDAQILVIGIAAWVLRVCITSFNDWYSRNAGLESVGEVRANAMSEILAQSPQQIPLAPGALSGLLTRGLDGLEIYVSRYLPQLVISAIVPLFLGAVILWLDPLSAVILLVTIPLIPLFMALVGWFTQSSVEKHWQEVNRLSGTLADLMTGLPELKIFGRARGLAKEIYELGMQQKNATMRVLRLSFLSAFVLELLSTISVALIAVAIGVRLVNGEIELWRGLAALIIAPEVYAPLRMLGVHFHAAAEGLEAWSQVKVVLDQPKVERGTVTITKPVVISWRNVSVDFGQRVLTIPDGQAKPGELTVISGPSGCGKSTLLSAILGTFTQYSGEILFDSSIAPTDIAAEYLPITFGFVSQSAWTGEGKLDQLLGSNASGLLEELGVELSGDVFISDRNQGVSVGQRRRIAVAKEMSRHPHILILDEPAAALDDESEQLLLEALHRYARRGHTVLVVAHRESVIAAADSVISFSEVHAS